jgi:two-component system, NtrC family, response regulator PilR
LAPETTTAEGESTVTQRQQVLIVDDEPDIRELLEITLGRMDLDTRAASDLASARALLSEQHFDLCLTDMNLPDGNGIDLVHLMADQYPSIPVAMITAHGSMDTAIEALKGGAFDFLQKPVDLDILRTLVESALKLKAPTNPTTRTKMIGQSASITVLRQQIARLARSQAPIYISGESGSGKEVAARLMHELGARSSGPFVPVNCGAIPGELMESEFFGHVKGAFTGAHMDKPGLFEVASGGTLFLDEVADLPLSMQVKLLRAIQEKSIRRVGSTQETPIDIRVLSATHRDLATEVLEGNFRQDLYYRLNVIELRVPALRDRPEDIPEFCVFILNKLAHEYGHQAPEISSQALNALLSYDYPGNVRELENILERAFTLCEGVRIEPSDLGLPVDDHGDRKAVEGPGAATPAHSIDMSLPEGESLEGYLERIERKLLTEALEATRWNKTAAAKQLGLSFRALRYRLAKLNME